MSMSEDEYREAENEYPTWHMCQRCGELVRECWHSGRSDIEQCELENPPICDNCVEAG